MILVAASWLWIGLSAFCVGYAVLSLLNKLTGYTKLETDTIFMMGICFLAVYAQFFSLIYKVGAVATALLFCIVLMILFFMRKSMLQYIKELCKSMQKAKWKLVLCLGLAVILTVITSGEVTHYDTSLYHAQSIRWIEEYGIVKGLGNLHNRLAYNSSVFCLQALFSMNFLVNQSLHSMNGFITLFLLGYGICSLKVFREGRLFISDFLRLGLIIFLNDSYRSISSPGSDLLPLGLACYILIKWISLEEDNEKHETPYALLCLLAVFGMTVKLSVTMMALLTMIPLVSLIKGKKWKEIFYFISAGIVIILPFLIRNVIISGYLVYPYPELDLFNVDWKMPAYTLIFDRNEIKTWGWGLNNVRLFNASFKEWFPHWYANLNRPMKLLFILNIPSAAAALIYGVYKGVRKDWRSFWIVCTVIANFILWFIGSPLLRYGSVYMMFMPLLVLGKIISSRCRIVKYAPPIIIALATYLISPMLHYGMECEWDYLKRCADYGQYSCIEYQLGNASIYIPESGDLTGYYAFPSTPYAARLELIELRGADISEGFRMQAEYRNAFVSPYGYVEENDMFSEN